MIGARALGIALMVVITNPSGPTRTRAGGLGEDDTDVNGGWLMDRWIDDG